MTPNTPATPSIKVEHITPQMAQQYLGTSAGNRSIKKRAVSRYARDMVGGKWVLNGEAIKFDRAGHLIDGHHRLNAIVESKQAVPILVIRGVQEGAMLTLDTGVGRSFSDALTVAGAGPVPHSLGAILRWWYKYELALMASGGLTPTHQELQSILERHPHIEESARFVNRLRMIKARMMPGVQGFVHAYATYRFGREMSDLFMQELNDGVALTEKSPIHLLRQRLIEVGARSRLDSGVIMALTIKAWNAWIDGKKISVLQWRTQGDNPEPFPCFKGDEERFERARQRVLQKRLENLNNIATAETRGKGGQAAAANRAARRATLQPGATQ